MASFYLEKKEIFFISHFTEHAVLYCHSYWLQ